MGVCCSWNVSASIHYAIEIILKHFMLYACVSSNDEFDNTESDELLDDLMPPVYDQEQMDISNQVCAGLSNMNFTASLHRMRGSVIAIPNCLGCAHCQAVTAS